MAINLKKNRPPSVPLGGAFAAGAAERLNTPPTCLISLITLSCAAQLPASTSPPRAGRARRPQSDPDHVTPLPGGHVPAAAALDRRPTRSVAESPGFNRREG